MARYAFNGKKIDFLFLPPTCMDEQTNAIVYVHDDGLYRFTSHHTVDIDSDMEIEDIDSLIYAAAEILGEEAFNGNGLKKEVYDGLRAAALSGWEAVAMADEEWDDED